MSAARAATSKPPDPQAEPERKRGFPSPFTILILVTILVWVAVLFIPSGQYQLDAEGSPIAGSFQEIPSPLDFPDRVAELLLAPVNGLYGIRDPATGQVGPFNSGTLFGAAQVFAFILAIGGFMTVVFATGALELGISHLAHRFRARGTVLIIALSLLFGLLGSAMSWSDETLGFYALMLPLMLSLGYDRMVVVAVVTVAPFVGVIGSTVNPFTMGIASDAAGVSIGDGLGWRLLLFALVMTAMIVYTVRYANRVQANPATSIVGIDPADAELAQHAAEDDLEPLSSRHKVIIGLVVFTFLLLTFSIVPWGAILNNTKADPLTHETVVNPFPWELGWWLPELSVMFLLMAVVVGVVGRLGEAGTARAFMRGVADFVGPAVLVVLARGVSVIMNNTKTIDTVLNAMENLVEGTSNVVFIILMYLVNLPLAFLIGSPSGNAVLTMPILAPLADFSGVDRSLVITAWNAAGRWFALILPTNGILLAGLGLAQVGYDQYLRFLLPLWAILLVIIGVILVIAALIQ
jgi:uncharacterized ion transporter superfamily protein YfcC